MKIDKNRRKVIFDPEDHVITLVPDEGLKVVKLADLFREGGQEPKPFEVPAGFVESGKALNEYYKEEILAIKTPQARKLVKEAREKGVVAKLPSWVLFDDPVGEEFSGLFNALEGGAKLVETEFLHNVAHPKERTTACGDLQKSLLEMTDYRLGRTKEG